MRRRLNLAAVVLAALLVASPAFSQATVRQVPLGFCPMSSMSAATSITTTSCVLATFTGTGSGNQVTASSVTGLISVGDPLVGTGVPASTIITGQLTPLLSGEVTGGAGRYTTNNTVTSSAASLTAGGVPQTANFALLCAYVQGIVYRDDGVAPTGTPGTGGQGLTAGQCAGYNGAIGSLQIIQQAGGAILGLTFYK